MTISYDTNHALIEQVILSWITTYAPVSQVRWVNQIASRPALPYASLQIISDGVMEGVDAEHEEFNVTTETVDVATYGPRRMTVQVTIYTGLETSANHTNARFLLSSALSALRTRPVKQTFKDAGLAFLQQLGPVQATDEQLGQRWERRASVDLEFGYTAITTDIGGTIGELKTVSPITEADGSLTIQE